ncbi:Uncharacterised protein [Mycobacteroides abscessus]|nr:Uncharacterised protein [Mycobacteroides abscessus]
MFLLPATPSLPPTRNPGLGLTQRSVRSPLRHTSRHNLLDRLVSPTVLSYQSATARKRAIGRRSSPPGVSREATGQSCPSEGHRFGVPDGAERDGSDGDRGQRQQLGQQSCPTPQAHRLLPDTQPAPAGTNSSTNQSENNPATRPITLRGNNYEQVQDLRLSRHDEDSRIDRRRSTQPQGSR